MLPAPTRGMPKTPDHSRQARHSAEGAGADTGPAPGWEGDQDGDGGTLGVVMVGSETAVAVGRLQGEMQALEGLVEDIGLA